MRRALVLVICLLLVPLSGVLADSPGTQTAAEPSLSISPPAAPGIVPRDLVGHNLPASSPVPLVVVAPDGSESALAAHTNDQGDLALVLAPSDGFAQTGIYRAVLQLGGGSAKSVLFTVGVAEPVLTTEPDVFSPYSALQILGAGLPPNQAYDLVLTPANDRGDRTFSVSTDAAGFLQAFIWPEELDRTFFEAGVYRATLPALGLSVLFQVREKPVGSEVRIDGPVTSGNQAPVHFWQYAPGRYLWSVYADLTGRVRGEMLFGLTNPGGSLDVTAQFTGLAGGQYHFATPYDWGETTFTALSPTPTPTPTATPTVTPTATSTPTTAPPKYKKVCKKHHGKKKCKRVKIQP